MQQELQVTLTVPDGLELDLTDRLADLDTLSQSLEEDLLEFVHDDISLDLDDSDGDIEDLLQHAIPGAEYIVQVWRTLERRRGARQLLFAGVLDLPWSVTYDRGDNRVSLQVFAYSKLLEQASAENVRRSVTGRTGTVTAASDTVTVSSTTDILPGDEITLEDNVNAINETQTVEAVLSGTSLRTVEVWDNAFTDAPLTLDTPYHRNETVEELAALLFEEAGITDYEIQVEQELSDTPFATAGNDQGLPLETRRSITIQSGNVSIVGQASGTQHADSPRDPFVDVDATTTAQIDWRPYLLTEPGSIVRAPAGDDTGTYAADHAAGDYYHLTKDPVGADPTAILELRRNGVFLRAIDTFTAGVGNANYLSRSIDLDVVNSEAWISFSRSDGTLDRTVIVPIPGGASQTTYDSVFGRLRSCRAVSRMLRLVSSTLEVHTLGVGKLKEREVPSTATLRVWTIRHADDYVFGIDRVGFSLFVVVWDETLATEIARFKIADGNYDPFTTAFDEPDGDQVGLILLDLGPVGVGYFVLSREFAGVIPYADFEGKSVAAALRDLAMVSFATVTVDEMRVGYLISRDAEAERAPLIPPTLPTPLRHESQQLTEQYRTSVVVTGKTEEGEDIEAIGGATGESQRRLELDSELITTQSLAQAIAEGYASYFARERSEERVTVQEEGDLIRPGANCILDGREYKCISADTDIEDNEQELRLIQRLGGDPL